MSGGVRRPRQQISPTWREDRAGSLNGKHTLGWQVVEGGVASSGVPFMAPLDSNPCHNKSIDKESSRHSPLGRFELVTSMWSKKPSPPQVLDLRQMVEHDSKHCVGSIAEGNGGRFRRGSGSSGPEKAAVEDR